MLKEHTMKTIAPAVKSPRQPGLLLVGFQAWAAPSPEGASESLREDLSGSRSRVVWDVGTGRLALGAVEHDSVVEALEGLAEHLEANQLAEVPAGPDDLGEVSFVHPPEAPPAAFFVRGNLVLSVTSFGPEPVPVLPYARQLDETLTARPTGVRAEDGVEVTEDGKTLRASALWGGPDAYVKFMADDAVLRKVGDGVEIEGDPRVVDIYVVEAGRETYARRLQR